jgi:hypothetical protein
MKRDEILAMKPGPEMNRLVGERLFGAKVRSYRKYEGGTLLYKLIVGRRTIADAFIEREGAWSGMQHYSEGLGHVEPVIEWIGARGYRLQVYILPGDVWVEVWTGEDKQDLACDCGGESLSEAICKAALLATLVEAKD